MRYTNEDLEAIHNKKVKDYTGEMIDKFNIVTFTDAKECAKICVEECLKFAEAPMDTRMLEDMLKAL